MKLGQTLLTGGAATLSLLTLPATSTNSHDYEVNSMNQRTYGVDVSFPHHHPRVSNNYDWLPHNNPAFASPSHPNYAPLPEEFKEMPIQRLGNRQDFYDHFMEGCRNHEKDEGDECDQTESDRIEMNLRQPQSMVNYTENGFAVIKTPKKVFAAIKDFWDKNQGQEEVEEWFTGNTYTNHWESPTWMLDVDNDKLIGGGKTLKHSIWETARHALQEWTGQELTPTSLYGIRKYTLGSILATHVDRLPLVTSAIINVAQDVEEPWPLEVYGHDGKAYNVTIEPGEMILYESHSVLHGRPFPLKGNYYANVFIHFEPVGHSGQHGFNPDNEEHYESMLDIKGGFNHNGGLPPYIIDGSLEAFQWRREHPEEEWEPRWAYEADSEDGTGSNGAHYAAHTGDVETLMHIIENPQHRTDMIHEHDENGWLPIHEAARSGHREIIEIFMKYGVDIHERTDFGDGQSVLDVAYDHHDEDSSFIQWLESIAEIDMEAGPDL
mmetsp:Transcript_22394/g.38426  ORF Transcript_22394/g.38426 Transcript_22394/m.38426 type:complete len:493 (+) Transcript_22394:84-1562(+)